MIKLAINQPIDSTIHTNFFCYFIGLNMKTFNLFTCNTSS